MHETRHEESPMDARLIDALAGCNGCDLEDADPADPRGYGPACQADSARETYGGDCGHTTSPELEALLDDVTLEPCRMQVGPEDRCGEPGVAWDRDQDEARCEAHAAEHLWRECYGWVPAHKSPLTFVAPR